MTVDARVQRTLHISDRVPIHQLSTGVHGLDEVLGGGIPEYSFNLIAGAPGTGKTTLSQQIMFGLATPERPALHFTIVGEPSIKMLRYQQQFSFFDPARVRSSIHYVNLSDEAARAGEQGKGFAVVADEVRKLAERSARETKQIAGLIAEVQTGTRDAVAAMDSGAAKVELGSAKASQAGAALEEILKAVQETVRQVGEIASSSQQMAIGARSVTEAMQSIAAVVEESSTSTEQMAAQASGVMGSIQSIAAVSEEQSAAAEEVSASTEQMSARVEEMTAQAHKLATTAVQLKELVATFKVEAASSSRSAPTGKKVVPLRRAA